MKCVCKSTVRILSFILVVALMITAFPAPAFAAIDEPLSGVTGTGWDDLGGMPGEPDNTAPPEISEPPDEDGNDGEQLEEDNDSGEDADEDSESSDSGSEPVATDGNSEPTATEGTLETATPTDATATAGTLGASGIVLDLPPDVLEDFITFMDNAQQAIESPFVPIRPLAGVGDTGTISWSWGERADFNAGGYYCNQIPTISLSTARPSEGRPFCAQFGPDPLTGGTYRASDYTHPTILKLMVAFVEGDASAVGVQLAIWSITNNASAFATHPEAQAALSAANSANTDGYSLLRWTTSGSYQPFFTLEKATDIEWALKIIKKSTSGKLLAGATFSVSGPGVNESSLTTNDRGEILVDIPSPGGEYTVTETAPPEGYLPADPASQTVTINTTNPSGTVVFENEPENPEEEEPGQSSFPLSLNSAFKELYVLIDRSI